MRQARSVELVAQRRRMELFMRSQVRPKFAAEVFATALLSKQQCQGTSACYMPVGSGRLTILCSRTIKCPLPLDLFDAGLPAGQSAGRSAEGLSGSSGCRRGQQHQAGGPPAEHAAVAVWGSERQVFGDQAARGRGLSGDQIPAECSMRVPGTRELLQRVCLCGIMPLCLY